MKLKQNNRNNGRKDCTIEYSRAHNIRVQRLFRLCRHILEKTSTFFETIYVKCAEKYSLTRFKKENSETAHIEIIEIYYLVSKVTKMKNKLLLKY